MPRELRRLVSLVAMVTLILGSVPVAAQTRRVSYLSDAETEHSIREMMRPIFQVAGLSPDGINIALVNDKTLNAFVAGGRNIFIHTGLLLEMENSDQLIGVLAHETGHIAGGHILRGREAMGRSLLAQLVGLGLGIAGGIASGNANVGVAGAMLGQQVGSRNYLAFSRGQESTADQAGLSYLEKAGISAKPLYRFLEKLGADNPVLTRDRDVGYVVTHPLTVERLDALKAAIERSPNSAKPSDPARDEALRRIQAKLQGYLDPDAALRRYKADDASIASRYGRAYAYFTRGDGKNAFPLIDGLIKAEPKNAFFHEMRGDLSLGNGDAAGAIPSYREAVRLAPPDCPSIRVSLAHALLERNDPKLAAEAIKQLDEAVRTREESAFAWRLMARAYAMRGNEPMATAASAEEAMLSGDVPRARVLADRAEKTLPKGSPGWLRAQDIRSQVDEGGDKDDGGKR